MKNRLIGGPVRVGIFAALACLGVGSSPSAQAQVKLDLKYPPGRALKHKTTTRTQQTLILNGMPIETEATQTVLTDDSVGKAREDASVPLTIKIDALKVDLSLPGGLNVNFDSAEPDAKIEVPQLAFLGDIFKFLSRVRYSLVLDKDGKLKAVEGTEAIREKAEALGDLAKRSVMGRLSAEKIKSQFEQITAKLPEILVRPGEPWERTETLELDAGQTLTFRKKYEYLGTEKKGDRTLDKIGVTITEVTYGQEPDSASPLKLSKSDLKVVSSSGTILFDREGGYLVLDKWKIQTKGPMTFTAGGQELAGSLDLTMETETETQPAAK